MKVVVTITWSSGYRTPVIAEAEASAARVKVMQHLNAAGAKVNIATKGDIDDAIAQVVGGTDSVSLRVGKVNILVEPHHETNV